jgi:hypothetical protein
LEELERLAPQRADEIYNEFDFRDPLTAKNGPITVSTASKYAIVVRSAAVRPKSGVTVYDPGPCGGSPKASGFHLDVTLSCRAW